MIRPLLEQLEGRLVPSTTGLSSAISISHPGSIERDWYTVDQRSNTLVEFQGTRRYDLGSPSSPFALNRYDEISASVDPKSGTAEAFVLGLTQSKSGSLNESIWLCDSTGSWHLLTAFGNYKGIGATGDGRVYAVSYDGSNIRYLDSSGNGIDLGAPSDANGPWAFNALAASVSVFGGNEVFAIGPQGAIYLNNTNLAGQWQLVDNTDFFATLSATPQNTVYALSDLGKLHLVSYQFFGGKIYRWTDSEIVGVYVSISADTDASGQSEVYAIQADPNADTWLSDKGSLRWIDSNVADISGADGGYFYDVHYDGGSWDAWQYNPYGIFVPPYSPWTYLGSGLQ
jgi:hypothetical protein